MTIAVSRTLDTLRVISARELFELAKLNHRTGYRQIKAGLWNECRTSAPGSATFYLSKVEERLGRTIDDQELVAVQIILAKELQTKRQNWKT